jgi:hypothetical protein
MKIKKLIATLAATATMSVLAMPANASDDGTVFENSAIYICAELDIQGLRDVLEHVDFASDDPDTGKDREGLNKKLDEAQAKLDISKSCDAAQKIDDFGWKIFNLESRSSPSKLKISDAYGGEAIECLLVGAEHLAADTRGDLTCEDAGTPPRGKGPKDK